MGVAHGSKQGVGLPSNDLTEKMSGPKTGSGAGSGIPASDRKLVSSLKEIVPNTEEEIYAMLRECNRDPDETAQRLLSEGKFHVVKRKRDKKKENVSNKESSDARPRPSTFGPSSRDGKSTGNPARGAGRGNSLPRFSTSDVNSGRSKTSSARENGTSKVLSSGSTNSSYSQPFIQPKGAIIDTLSSSLAAQSNGDILHPAPAPSLQGAWNAGSGSSIPTGLQGAWLSGSGHATMADMLKSGGARMSNLPVSIGMSNTSVPGPLPVPISSQQLLSVPSVSGVYLAALDPVLNPLLESRARSSAGAAKRDVGTVGNQRDRSSFVLSDGTATSPKSHYVQLPQVNSSSVVLSSDSELDVKALHPTSSPVSITPSPGEQLEDVQNLGAFPSGQGHSLGLVESSRITAQSPSRAGLLGSHFASISLYQHKGSTNIDWNSQPLTQDSVSVLETQETPSSGVVIDEALSGPSSPAAETRMLSAAAKMQELNIRDDQPVIIPDHLRVSEADCTRLSFGSFDSGFETFPSSFTAENKSASLSVSENVIENQAAVADQMADISTTSTNSGALDQHTGHLSVTIENLDTAGDSTVSSNPMDFASQSELLKPDQTSQQSPQYRYITAPQSYPGVNLVSPNLAGQIAIEQSEARHQENRIPSVLQPYSDPTTYYSGVFRSGPEGDARYSALLPSTVTGKYGAGRPAGTGQSAQSQEGTNTMVYLTSNALGQTLQSGNAPTTMSVPQQSLPIHAYAAQPSALPMGPFANVFSYQYMPPGFSYMQSPYQQNYTGAGNAYQVPSVAAPTVKYPVPQYKPGGTVGAGMHSAIVPGNLGYGGYSNSQPGTYAVNPPVTAGNTSSFDDVASQYKDTNMYIPGQQQVEGSAVWLQSQLSRDMPGVQGSSYYNIPGQSQQTRYSQTQSVHAHSHPGGTYGNIYHPQQSGPSPSVHQLLQQPQVLGSVGAVGTQVGSYQQAQRAQQTWTNSF